MKKFDIKTEFAKALEKSGVQSVIKQRQTLQEQIMGILSPEGKFKSISDKIKDMQERAGVFKLNGVKKAILAREMFIKTFDEEIKLFKILPSLKKIIIDYVEINYSKNKPAIEADIKKGIISGLKNKDVNPEELLEEDSFKKFLDNLINLTRESKEINVEQDINLSHNPEISTEDESLNSDILFGAQKHE